MAYRSSLAAQISFCPSESSSPRQLQASNSTYICQHSENQSLYLSSTPQNAFCHLDISQDEAMLCELSRNELSTHSQLIFRPCDRSTPSQISLSENNTLLFGSTQLQFLRTVHKDDQLPSEPNFPGETCRVCYDSGFEEQPLLAICHCSGSTKYIHRECLGRWIESKMNVKPGAKIIQMQKSALVCEICRANYLENEHFSLISVMRKFFGSDTWGLFELNPASDNPSILLIKLTSEGILIGRSNTADLYFHDKSVSRSHARLSYKQKRVVVEDINSRSGTWVLADGGVSLVQHRSVELQFADTRLEVKLQRVQRNLHGCED